MKCNCQCRLQHKIEPSATPNQGTCELDALIYHANIVLFREDRGLRSILFGTNELNLRGTSFLFLVKPFD